MKVSPVGISEKELIEYMLIRKLGINRLKNIQNNVNLFTYNKFYVIIYNISVSFY